MTSPKRSIFAVGALLLPFLIGLLAWAFKTYDADLIHRREYDLDRQADSTQLQRLDRRSLVTLCKVAPSDSECAR